MYYYKKKGYVSGIALEYGHSSARVGRINENIINDSFTFPFGG